jgi:hypothetical protein
METNVNAPAMQLRTDRGLAKMILLSLITFGIYALVIESHIGEELNLIASRHDGRRTMHFCLIYFIFSWLTLGIAPIVWYHRTSDRMHGELVRRQIDYDFGATDFWLWCILGSLIVIGPYVYIYKRMKAMNLINEDYNQKG